MRAAGDCITNSRNGAMRCQLQRSWKNGADPSVGRTVRSSGLGSAIKASTPARSGSTHSPKAWRRTTTPFFWKSATMSAVTGTASGILHLIPEGQFSTKHATAPRRLLQLDIELLQQRREEGPVVGDLSGEVGRRLVVRILRHQEKLLLHVGRGGEARDLVGDAAGDGGRQALWPEQAEPGPVAEAFQVEADLLRRGHVRQGGGPDLGAAPPEPP